ncbi:MAG: 50S ribosomal protein L23 [Syntrophothermus sp.]
MGDPRSIIKRPLVTEKSTRLIQDQNKYTFEVALTANKTEIKQAIEEIFKVTVTNVTTMRVLGKTKRMGRYEGKRPDWKKAIVTLKPGDRIEAFEGA